MNKKIRTASDGSLDKDKELVSFGWLLIAKGNVLVEGAGPVDGVPDLLSSTRSELFGIGAVVEFLRQFCKLSSMMLCDRRAGSSSTWTIAGLH